MSKSRNFSLNIHHRSIKLSNNSTIYPNTELLAGHFYMGLERHGEEIFFNEYPKKIGFLNNLIDSNAIKRELAAVYGSIDAIEDQNLRQCITTKIIPLTAEQFVKVYRYILTTIENKVEAPYLLYSGNADYIQSLYHAAGLPLYFTTIYSQNELKNLQTHAAKYALLKYGSRDTLEKYFRNISSSSKEELVERLNISEDTITPILIPTQANRYCFFSVSIKDIPLPYKPQLANTQNQEALISQLKGVFAIPLPYPVPYPLFVPEKKWGDIIPIPLFYMTQKVISSGPAVMKTEQMKDWLENEKTYEAELYLNFTKFNDFIKFDEIASRVSTDIAKFLEKFLDFLNSWDALMQRNVKTERKEHVTFFTKLKKFFIKKAATQEVNIEEHIKIEERQIEKIQLFNKVIQEINERFGQVAYEIAENFNFLAITAQGKLPDEQISPLFNINHLTTTFLQVVVKELDMLEVIGSLE